MHKINSPRTGCSKLKNENFEKYKSKISGDLEKAQNLISEKTNFTPTAIVYPFGAFDKNTEKIIKSLGFLVKITLRYRGETCKSTCHRRVLLRAVKLGPNIVY